MSEYVLYFVWFACSYFTSDFGSFTSDTQDDFGSLLGATAADYSMPSVPAPAPVASLVTLTSKDTVSTKENKAITLKRGDIAAENVSPQMKSTK